MKQTQLKLYENNQGTRKCVYYDAQMNSGSESADVMIEKAEAYAHGRGKKIIYPSLHSTRGRDSYAGSIA